MKKVMFLMAVAGMMLAFAACEKDEIFETSSTVTSSYLGYRIIDGKIKAIDIDGTPHDVPDGLLPELRAERIYKEEGSNPLVAQSLAPRQLNTASPATTSTSFPYNYGINNEVTASLWLEWNGVTLRPLDTLFVKGHHVVDNTATGPFVEQSHTQYTLCWADGSTVVISGDSISCRQNFAIREVLPTVVHDTVWRERVIHDTIHHTDTVWRERVVHDTVVDGRWVDSVVTRCHVVVSHHHISTTTTDTYTASTSTTGSLETRCTNRTDSTFTERLYIWYSDATVDSTRTRNWSSSHNWYKIWTRSVAIYGTNPGSGRATMSGNVADFGGGFRVVLGNPVVTTSPAGYNPNSTDCTHSVTYMVASATGITEKGAVVHGAPADTTQGFIPCNGTTPPTPPTIIRIDTAWGNCTTANNGVYNPYTERVSFVVHKQYRLDTVFSDNTHGYSSWLTANATYQYMVSRTGQPTVGMINNLPTTIGADNTASFGGAFTETLTPIGTQRFCPLTLTSAVLTSNGTVWTGSYGTSTPTVTVTETWATDTTITIPGQLLFVGVTLSVRNDITPGLVNPEYFVNVVYSAGGTVHHRIAPLEGFNSGTPFTDATVSATVAQIQGYIAAGKYPAKCYNHVTQNYVLGTVNEVLASGQWVIQWFSYTNRTNHYNTINSISNVFVDGQHPAIILGSFITSDGTITINGANYTFTGSNL